MIQLLRLLGVAEKLHADCGVSTAYWSRVVRLQQLAVAVLGVLLQTGGAHHMRSWPRLTT